MPWEELEHTADAAFRVWAEDLEELFVDAARALFELIADLENVEPKERVEIEVEADDLVELFHDWLEELLFRHEVNEMLFSDFEVKIEKKDGGYRLEGVAMGEPIDPEKHTIHT
ncbi:MAG: archease, partial [Methanopyri archaeon]|nr:archease [Methanopyri archaeon]